jgi:hypothetical protein
MDGRRRNLTKLWPWSQKPAEGGFILVWMSLIITVLLGIAGFAVDFGNWYLNIQHTQRAADAAALAGDPLMPDWYNTPNPNGQTARQLARDELLRNGVSQADADAAFASENCSTPYCIAGVPGRPTQLQVRVRVTVQNAFFPVLGLSKSNNFDRRAIADYTPELHINSMTNVLGGPEPNDGSGRWGTTGGTGNRNYWLQMGGRQENKPEGDRLNSAVCNANAGVGGEDGCSGGQNDEWNDDKGYVFFIDVKPTTTGPATAWLELQAYDANMTASYADAICPDGLELPPPTCPADELYGETTGFAPLRFTFYRDENITNSNIETTCRTFNQRTVGDITPQWEDICQGRRGRFEVNMRTGTRIYMRAHTLNGTGTNHFMLRGGLFASSTGGAVRPDSTNLVRISADKHMSIYNEIDGRGPRGTNSTFILGQIGSAWAGRTIHFEFWDVGDAFDVRGNVDGWLFLEGNPAGGPVSQALNNGTCVFTRPGAPGSAWNENHFVPVDIDVGRFASNCGFNITRERFNGRLVKLNWTIPTSYRCVIRTESDCVLKVSMDMNGNVADDTTTSVIEPGKPLRLIK